MASGSRKRATLKDVAKAAGVSLASTSYAINRTGSLGEETRAHILKTAEELGYRQNLAARATRTGRTGAIGFIVPDMANPFFPSLAQAIIQRARQSGYSVFVADTEGDLKQEAESFRALVDRGVDGVVWFPINDDSKAGSASDEIPTVVIDRTLPGLECIQAEYAEGGKRAAEYLIALGHKDIGVVSGPMDVKSMRDRCNAAITEIKSNASLAFEVSNAFSTELESSVCKAIEGKRATAVFVGADLIAIGILSHARAAGIRIPEDLSIVGFDDIPWAAHSNPTLTTIEMPVDEMAIEAVDAVIRRIDGEGDGSKRVIFEVNLIERETAIKPRKRR